MSSIAVTVKDAAGKGLDERSIDTRYLDDRVRHRLIKEALDAGRLVTALGAAPVVLAEAGVLKGVRATCYPFGQPPGVYRRRLERAGAILADVPAETTGLFVTGRGPNDINAFADAVVKQLNAP